MLNPVDFNFGAHKRMNSLVLKSVMNEWKSYILNIWHLQRNKTMGLTWEKFEISLSGIYKKHIIRNMGFLQTIQQIKIVIFLRALNLIISFVVIK